MCCDCWASKYDSPRIDSPAVRAAVDLIRKVYEYHPAGGHLHAQLDDYNLEDRFFDDESSAEIDQLERYSQPNSYEPSEAGHAQAAERACFDAFKAMTLPERVSALSLSEGCWK